MAYSKTDLTALGEGLDRILRPFTYGVRIANLFTELYGSTTDSMEFWVDGSTGDDRNQGTALAPLRTIQAAVDLVPKRIRHAVTIHVAAGNYTGYRLANFSAEPDSENAAYLIISGTMGTATLASGLTSGTVASATAGSTAIASWSTVTVTGAGWTSSNLRCKFIKITGGTGSGQVKAIYDNTATVITVTGTWSTTPDATSTFEIVEPATIITTSVSCPGEIGAGGLAQSGTAAFAGVFVTGGMTGGTSTTLTNRARIGVRWMKFANGSASGVHVVASARAGVWACSFANTSTNVTVRQPGSEVTLNECVTTTATSLVAINVGAIADISNCISSGGSTGLSAQSGTRFNVQTSAFLNMTSSVLNLSDGSPSLGLFLNCICTGSGGSAQGLRKNSATTLWTGHLRFSSCSFSTFITAFDSAGPMLIQCQGLSGTGNATVFNITKGAMFSLDSSSTITGTNEIVLDGAAAVTVASMRAASPKVLSNNTYYSRIFE